MMELPLVHSFKCSDCGALVVDKEQHNKSHKVTEEQDKALTEIQRVVTRATSRGDNSEYLDQISDIITDELIDRGSD
jgi:hypothetical protein